MKKREVWKVIGLTLRITVLSFGVLSILMVLLSFTSLPYKAYYALAAVDEALTESPDYIVILGGNGMPSGDGLQRAHFGASVAEIFPEAKVIIALPSEKNKKDSLLQLRLMAAELVLKNVDTTRIIFEPIGDNTFTQSQNVWNEIAKKEDKAVLIVTSPEHMYRSIHTFRKSGFKRVGGFPTFEDTIDEMSLKRKKKRPIDRVENVNLRYNMWSYLHYEIKVLREYTAIGYYKLKGWI